ncbi:endolytic transglycosylase MltG [Tenacibaculum sp. SG-28]|uniref:endolytic transglycosylase MltG n=1 Tax=Tenacibaculum sp. SG-28 TaxID=754426 RepID=UPI000CF52B4F|nr:endolytic transglycosylase MltG [Tenacibaculum sp. SG-28]PQJ19882.1 aminodeoxychorismate lyase [Tenacibaculum sp. SG-28]
MRKKIIFGSILTLVGIAVIIGFSYYQKVFGKAVAQNGSIYIRSSASIEEVGAILQPYLKSKKDFVWVAKRKKFLKPKAGKYTLQKGMNLNDLVNKLRSGNQTPIKLSFNNQDTLEKLAQRIATQIEADSSAIFKVMTDSTFLVSNGFTSKSALGMYIPNSYEVYWTITPEKLRKKMLFEYRRFWNQDRIEKAKKLQLNKQEVITLASIVQKETAKREERPIVAGLYINRLQRGIPLQADPTIIYCVKEQKGQDFIVKRVLNKDLEIQSPYNTYQHRGLPPTLIGMPDISSIDAVLNYKKHKYLYMCASVTKIGYHEFAKTLSQHNKNSAKYHRWINSQGINR